MKTINGRVNIMFHRQASRSPDDRVVIELIDNDSRAHFATVYLAPEDFMRGIFGLGELHASIQVRGLDRLGLKRENKNEIVPLDRRIVRDCDPMYMTDNEIERLCRPFCTGGWRPHLADFRNYHNYIYPHRAKGAHLPNGGVRVSFVRYVNTDGEPVTIKE